MARMSRAQNEYDSGSKACLAGTFNALLEPLSNVHPDVLIIISFRSMMQEISMEEDDAEFARRVNHALSYLGENAASDKDYKADIEAYTEARIFKIDYEIEELKNHPETERGFARQKNEVDRLQALRRSANGKLRKGKPMQNITHQQRIAQLKLDERARNLPCRVAQEVAHQNSRIKRLRRLTPQSYQDMEAI